MFCARVRVDRRVSFGVHKTIAAGPLSTAIDRPTKTIVADSLKPGGNERYYYERLVRLFRYIQRSCIHYWRYAASSRQP